MKLSMLLLYFMIATLVSGCGNTNTAGGSSEETNAIAGVLLDGNGKPVANAWVEVRPSSDQFQSTKVMKVASIVSSAEFDTTDAKGRWSVQVKKSGNYTILAGDDAGRRSLRKVTLLKSLEGIQDTLLPSVPFQTIISCRWNLPQGVIAVIPGTMYYALADSVGKVQFDSLPQGDYLMKISSGDAFRYEDIQVQLSIHQESDPKLLGPFSGKESIDSSDWKSAGENEIALAVDTITLPLLYDYGVRASWDMNSLYSDGSFEFFAETRGRAGQGVVYGGALAQGVFGLGIQFSGAEEFGVVESAGSVFDSIGAFSIELWFKLNDLPTEKAYLRNLFGQMGFAEGASADLFSIALVQNGDGKPTVGFLLSDGNSGMLDSNTMVRSSVEIGKDSWNYVLATWDGSKSCIMVNAEPMACKQQEFSQLFKSPEPLYFGKENLNVVLDEIRIIDINMDQNDARYRWLRRLQ